MLAQTAHAFTDADLQMWNTIAGFLSPLALAFIIQTGWSKNLQALLAFLFAAVMAVITTTIENKLDWDNWVTSMFVVFTATISAYYGFWKPTGIAPKIEAKTSAKAA